MSGQAQTCAIACVRERARPLGRALRTRAERETTLEGLRSAHGFLQARLAGELRLKRTPTLEFVYDETTDRALRVDELIAQEEPS